MKKIFDFIVKRRRFFLIFWAVMLVGSIILIPFVKINYDTTEYLPGDAKVKKSLAVMEKEFGLNGQASIMIGEVTISEAVRYKKNLASTDGVAEIIWLDNFIEPAMLEQLDQFLKDNNIDQMMDIGSIKGLDQFYHKKHALFQVLFTEDEYSLKTGDAIEALRGKLDRLEVDYAMTGMAISSYYTRVLTTSEVFKITLYVIPIILIILIIFTSSWIEPLLFVLVVASSVLVNMGTNIIFPSISFLTNSTASLLQLAITMDYAIFLLHRYTKEREEGQPALEAIKNAMTASFLPINSSMLTTAAGFAALIFMRYSIGLDLALVMIKGILLSIVTTFTLMPPLILLFDKLLQKTKHRPFFPGLGKFTKYIHKLRYILPILVLLIIIPSYTTQNKNHFIYGQDAMSASENTKPGQETKQVESVFGKSNPIVLLVPNDVDIQYERDLIDELQTELNVLLKKEISVQALSTVTNIESYMPSFDALPPILKDFINQIFNPDWIVTQMPEDFKDQLQSENYNRIIISIPTDEESAIAFEAVEKIDTIVYRYYFDEYHLISSSSSVLEVKKLVESDFIVINILSIALVLLILFFSFKSLTIPLILVLCIELSVWINMSIPYLTNEPLIFIGYIIVSSVQLGATIDYGILLSQNYLNDRKEMSRKEAFKKSIVQSGPSILTSALILASAGYSLKFVSSIEGVSSLGELIGRGALLSGFFVLILLPQILFIFDTWIEKTTYKIEFFKLPEDEETSD